MDQINNEQFEEVKAVNIESAVKHYRSHLKAVSNYQKRNKDKMSVKCKNYMEKIKADDPERFEQILQAKRDYYYNVQKPKLLAKKNEKKNL